jgi:type IV secretion system protein VirB11
MNSPTAASALLPRIDDDASVKHLMRPLQDLLSVKGATELVINDPGVAFLQRHGVWERHELPHMSYDNCYSLAVSIATFTNQAINEAKPILSATLPDGERIQIIIPPITPRHTVSFTIRIPSPAAKSLDDYQRSGMFDQIVTQPKEISQQDEQLLEQLHAGNYQNFFRLAVRYRKNLAIVGETGSGKTTFCKTLCNLIPTDDRVITIEDVRELFLPKHENKVHLLYSSQGVAQVGPADLVRCTMRMKPDWMLPAELRGAEAFDFVNLLTTGHKGFTSFHAESCSVAFERFALMCKEHPKANTYTHGELMRLLYLTLDVIVHIECVDNQRRFTEIYFDPYKKHALATGRETGPALASVTPLKPLSVA